MAKLVTAAVLLSLQPWGGACAFTTLHFTPQRQHAATRIYSSSTSQEIDWPQKLAAEAKELAECASLAIGSIFKPDDKITAQDIVQVCDTLDKATTTTTSDSDLFVSKQLQLRTRALEMQRYEYLVKLMKTDYDGYVATASFLSPSRIPRRQLPNLQDVHVDKNSVPKSVAPDNDGAGGVPLMADCELDSMVYQDSPLDKLLLHVFRKLVAQNTGGVTSDKPGIDGLLEQGRTFMLQPGQTPEAQHKMVSDTLGGLMTPVLPPFYRLFMSGVVPKLGTDFDGKQLGPWFYAPFLTSVVTPSFFGFLVGPSYPNRRKDGQLGGAYRCTTSSTALD
jgi:hypothetical protein